MSFRLRVWAVTGIIAWATGLLQAQEPARQAEEVRPVVAVQADSAVYAPPAEALADSLTAADSAIVRKDSAAVKKDALEAPVTYTAVDSIVMTADNMAYLYGQGDVKYQQIQLQSELIEMSMDSSVIYAVYGKDSTGMPFGFPLFIDTDQQIEAKEMRYNFKTRKAYATEILTQQGEGYLTATKTKKMADGAMNIKDGVYTTCDEHEHPHFYIRMTRAKVRPGKNTVAGPAYLVIADVPLYMVGLPFAFFPFTDTYSSGIIMPSYGDEMQQGFFLRDGGYYFALSDYIDLAVTGEIYTKGSWGLAAKAGYRKRYKYSGNFNASYLVTKWGDKWKGEAMPDYQVAKAFKLVWSHSQDAKANPYRTFSASVNFSTNQYDRNQIKGQYTMDATQNNKGSSVSLSQRFPNSPFSISATMNINQRSQDSTLSVTLPDITMALSRIYPLKRKNAVGSDRWYEKISLSYSGYLRNNISTKENQFLQSSLVKDWKNAMQHSIPISATYSMFGYLNISPSVQYQERWYTNKVMQEYDSLRGGMVMADTTYGFYRVYNYSASISASTTLYGFFTPWPVFQKLVKTIRHRMEPSLSYSMTPDFGAAKYGYYEDYSYVNSQGQTVTGYYSPFQNQLFGVPGRGKQGSVSLSLENNVEAKVASSRDSSGVKKISLIDNLGLRMSYNLAADSFQWSDLSASLRLKLSRSYTLNLSGTFDTYTYGYNEATQSVYRVNKPRWEVGKGLGRLRSTGSSFSYTLNNNTFKQWFGGKGETDQRSSRRDEEWDEDDLMDDRTDLMEEETQTTGKRLREKKKTQAGEYDEEGYYNATIPWSFSFSYNVNLGYGAFKPEILEYDYRWTHALSFNGSIQPTKNWNITFNATYDFPTKRISYMTCNVSRNLHCFQMSASIIPVGYRKSYMFSIAVNSSLLKDLKYQQSSSLRSGQTWY
jgi:hypothetical protein